MATWHRTDIALTDVYEIMNTLGQGHMGEVYKVRRKVENRGLHNAETRGKTASATSLTATGTGTDTGTNTNTATEIDNVPEELLNAGGGPSGSGLSLRAASMDLSERSVGSLGSKSSSNLFKSRRQKKNQKLKNDETLKKAQEEEKRMAEEEEVVSAVTGASPAGSPRPPPRSILRNPLEVDPGRIQQIQQLSQQFSDADIDNDEVIPPLGLAKTTSSDQDLDTDQEEDQDKEGSPQDPNQNTKGFRHKDSVMLLHPHFSALTDCFEPSSASETVDESHTEALITGGGDSGSENDSDRTDQKEKKRWVPRRKIRFQRLYACKTIGTEKIDQSQMEELLNEIYMMRKMDHPYIIRLYEVYQVKRKIWLVMDLCTGGNLTTRKLKEPEVTVVMEQILRGIAYLHRRGICHRDLKLENILYEDGSANSTIRLIDFGLSQTYEESDQAHKGAAYCLSPELAGKTGQYTEKSDVWSIGSIAWILLAGDFPFIKVFEDLKDEKKKKRLIDANFEFGITWRGRGITPEAKSFVAGCFKKDPAERWTAIEALEYLQDQWIPKLEEKGALEVQMQEKRIAALPQKKDPKKRKNSDIKIYDPSAVLVNTFSSKAKKEHDIFDHDIMDDIMRFTESGVLKKTALIALANTMDRKDAGSLSELFLLLDTDQTGTISPDELKVALRKLNMPNMDEGRMDTIFAGIDHDRSGQIHFAEFLAALAEGAGLVTMERISDAFDRIDHEGKGYISHQDLKKILGDNYSKEVAEEMIEEGDFKKNGRIDYDEFIHLMTDEGDAAGIELTDSLRSLSEIGFDGLKDEVND